MTDELLRTFLAELRERLRLVNEVIRNLEELQRRDGSVAEFKRMGEGQEKDQ